MIKKKELVNSLEQVNNVYFHIDNIDKYAKKLLTHAKHLVHRNELGEMISFLSYYDDGPEIFVTMLYTKPEYQGQGYAKANIQTLIREYSKDIVLETNKKNPAFIMYKRLRFIEENCVNNIVKLRRQRRLSIMQPYFFPHINYFQLITASDYFIFYDDVNFIKNGWINKNKILVNQSSYSFTVPVLKASQNRLIKDTLIHSGQYAIWREKFCKTIEQNYSKAPHYKSISNMIRTVLSDQNTSIANLAISSVLAVFNHLKIDIEWSRSSMLTQNTSTFKGADRVIEVSKNLGYRNYLNSIGGIELYNEEHFKANGIKLEFIESIASEYKQFNSEFVPGLSIIDVLMFNSIETVRDYLQQYQIVRVAPNSD